MEGRWKWSQGNEKSVCYKFPDVIETTKEQAENYVEQKQKKLQALKKQKEVKSKLEKQKKLARNKKLENASTYAGVKMYLTRSEFESKGRKTNFGGLSLNVSYDKDDTNWETREIVKIHLSSSSSNIEDISSDKQTNKMQKLLYKKYKYLSKSEKKQLIKMNDIKLSIKDKHLKNYRTTKIDMQREIDRVKTDEIRIVEEIIFKNKDDIIVFNKWIIKYNNQNTYFFTVDFISKQYLNKSKKKNTSKLYEQQQDDMELEGL